METFSYHSLDELQSLSLEALYNLWELVPTARQKRYLDCLEREVRLQGAHGSDKDELIVVNALLERYMNDALVPVGSRWVKAPPRILEAARSGAIVDAPESDTASSERVLNPLLLLGGGALLFVMMLGLLFLRGGSDADIERTVDVALITPTPRRTPTPTPIALVESDDIIRDGDRDRALAYPIGLQILSTSAEQPRVFIVQRRRVDLAEWQYDPNPDTVSFLSDLAVRKVIGIPYSRENAALFDDLEPGAEFVLRLNTGGELRFAFSSKQEVSRSDTTDLRQLAPGLVLVLIGETGRDGLPTGQRQVVTASYIAEQELSGDGQLLSDAPLVTSVPTQVTPPTSTPFPVDSKALLHVALIGNGVETHAETNSLIVHVRIFNSQSVQIQLEPEDFRLALGYTANLPGPWMVADQLSSFTLQSGQAVDMTLYWSWQGEPFAALELLSYVFHVEL